MSIHGGRQACADTSGNAARSGSSYGHAARLAARPLPPDARGTAADAITQAGGAVAVHAAQEPLVRILLAAADDLRGAGHPDQPATARDLVGAVVAAVARHGDLNGHIADAQADACYALLGHALGVSPLAWPDRPGSTRLRAVEALTTAARKAAQA